MSKVIERFELNVPEGVLVDLQARLKRTRWPEAETVADWSQGAPLAKVKALCAYWADGYDWRRCEAKLNGFGQFETEIDGTKIHFLHVKSPNHDALPMIMTHGWPGSVVEFLKVIGPLTDPAAHGGDPADAFHVVVPSLPGYGFSGKPAAAGYGVERIAETWVKLMRRLGYKRFVAQGGDWGAAVTTAIGIARPPECAAIHLNMPLVFPEAGDFAELTEEETAAVAAMEFYREHDSGYAKQQGTRPQTLGYGLTDSPAGQAAWIYEKFYAWTDNTGDPESALSRDEMLDNIMLYWLPANATSSARLYWESVKGFTTRQLDLPVGVSIFPKEMFRPSRRWAERSLKNLIHWNELDKGGHFAAFEQPEIFVDEVRTCFRQIRRVAR
jgi:pimeloyl-ACP methyl ester carboxylesterase